VGALAGAALPDEDGAAAHAEDSKISDAAIAAFFMAEAPNGMAEPPTRQDRLLLPIRTGLSPDFRRLPPAPTVTR
jgi:hypothetical protein